eukprot:m.165502 g.165502  ORF g.165502 m.165502 type:complete len:736 (+) comp12569_c0_seq1:361-2568(+)
MYTGTGQVVSFSAFQKGTDSPPGASHATPSKPTSTAAAPVRRRSSHRDKDKRRGGRERRKSNPGVMDSGVGHDVFAGGGRPSPTGRVSDSSASSLGATPPVVGRERRGSVSSVVSVSGQTLPSFGNGRYNTIKRLGAGNFGTCWLVQDTEQSLVGKVVKQVFIGGLTQDETVDALKEAKLLQSLRHPNVVGYYDAFVQDGQFVCIVMEYCDSGDLAMAIEQNVSNGRNFAEVQIMEWAIQLLLALRYLHDRKVLHRDIKTKNIFVKTPVGNDSGSGFHTMVQLGDFGIARVLLNTAEEVQSLAGTPYYMSPECLKGIGYNSKSDVWSLACVLYELCNLEMPFKGDSLLTLTKLICDGDLPSLPGWLSEPTRHLLQSMLERDADMRPSALQLLSMPACHPYFESFNDALSDHLATTQLQRDVNRIHRATEDAEKAFAPTIHNAPPDIPPPMPIIPYAASPYAAKPKKAPGGKKQRKDPNGRREPRRKGRDPHGRAKPSKEPTSTSSGNTSPLTVGGGMYNGHGTKKRDPWIKEHPDIFPNGRVPDDAATGLDTNRFSVFTAESAVGTNNGMRTPMDPNESVRSELLALKGELGTFLDGTYRSVVRAAPYRSESLLCDPAPKRVAADYGMGPMSSVYDPSEDRRQYDGKTTRQRQQAKAIAGLGRKDYNRVHRAIRKAYRNEASSEQVHDTLQGFAKHRGVVDGTKLRLYYVVEDIVAQEESERAAQAAKSRACAIM